MYYEQACVCDDKTGTYSWQIIRFWKNKAITTLKARDLVLKRKGAVAEFSGFIADPAHNELNPEYNR
jgi:hypothetical protein